MSCWIFSFKAVNDYVSLAVPVSALTHFIICFTAILSKINDDDDDNNNDLTRISRLRATERKHFPAKMYSVIVTTFCQMSTTG